MQAIPSPQNCCDPCTSPIVENIPGPAGADGADGAAGVAGQNAFTYVTTQFVQPAVGATVNVEVTNSEWAGDGSDVFLDWGGYYLVTAIPDSTHLTLKNRGYVANSPPGTIIPVSSLVTAAGEKGAAGADGASSGDMIAANNLSDLTNTTTALNNLLATTIGKALFLLTNPSALGYLRANADNTITHRTYANVRDDLDVVPGTDVQAWDAALDALANGVTAAANVLPYFTSGAAATTTPLTTFARTILDDADAATVRSTIGVLPRYGLIGYKSSADLNSAASDNAITMDSTRYRIDKIVLDNASISLTTATVGVFTAAGGGGTTVVADQAVAALTATTKFLDLTLGGSVTADVLTAATLYFRVGTAQGAAATANVWIFGWSLA